MEWYTFNTPVEKLLATADCRISDATDLLKARLVLLEKRWDHLQDVCSEAEKTLDEEHPRMERLYALSVRAELMHEMMEDRIKHLKAASSAIEDCNIAVDDRRRHNLWARRQA
jgi:hypothetical protein